MKRFILSCLWASLIVGSAYSNDYREEVILRNYWNDNKLPLTRKVYFSPGDGGYAVYVPYKLIVKNDELFIFDLETPTFVKVDEHGQLEDTYYLEYEVCRAYAISDSNKLYLTCVFPGPNKLNEYDLVTHKMKALFALDEIADIFYDETEGVFYKFGYHEELVIYNHYGKIEEIPIAKILEDNMDYYDFENYVHKGIVYSPVEKIRYDEDGLYASAVSKYDINEKRIDSVKSKGGDFGFIILGIDSKGNIYSSNNWELTKILIHDKKGNFLTELIPEYDKYGTEERGLGTKYLHSPFITEDGEIYMMIRTKEGLFVVKYTPELVGDCGNCGFSSK